MWGGEVQQGGQACKVATPVLGSMHKHSPAGKNTWNRHTRAVKNDSMATTWCDQYAISYHRRRMKEGRQAGAGPDVQ
jgi:hypothetical protein